MRTTDLVRRLRINRKGASELQPSSGYAAAIFDLDGTLLNTVDDLAASANYALQRHGLPTRSIPEITSYIGNGVRHLMAVAVPEGTDPALEQQVFQDFQAHYAQHHLDRTAPYPGIRQLLADLAAKGIRLAVVSNKSDADVQVLIQHFFPDTFEVVVGEKESEGVRRKPAPDTVNACVSRFGLPRERCVYIGDSEVDVLTANNAQMDVIVVTWGFRQRAFVERYGAKVFADTTQQLERLIVGQEG